MNSIIIILSTAILKLFSLSCRRRHLGLSPEERLASVQANNYIAAIWHQNLANGVFAFNKRPHIAMVSLSKDGEIATRIAKNFGFTIARGSASRGGKKALLEMIKTIKSGVLPGVLTVDGPRGPLHQVKHGVIELAKQTQVPIMPVIAFSTRAHIFKKSWDHFRLPLPFATIYSMVGEPLLIPSDTPKEQFDHFARELTTRLQQLEMDLLNYLNR